MGCWPCKWRVFTINQFSKCWLHGLILVSWPGSGVSSKSTLRDLLAFGETCLVQIHLSRQRMTSQQSGLQFLHSLSASRGCSVWQLETAWRLPWSIGICSRTRECQYCLEKELAGYVRTSSDPIALFLKLHISTSRPGPSTTGKITGRFILLLDWMEKERNQQTLILCLSYLRKHVAHGLWPGNKALALVGLPELTKTATATSSILWMSLSDSSY